MGLAPTAAHLEGFLSVVPEIVDGKGEDGAVSYGHVVNGVNLIIDWCEFNYKAFTITEREKKRLRKSFHFTL